MDEQKKQGIRNEVAALLTDHVANGTQFMRQFDCDDEVVWSYCSDYITEMLDDDELKLIARDKDFLEPYFSKCCNWVYARAQYFARQDEAVEEAKRHEMCCFLADKLISDERLVFTIWDTDEDELIIGFDNEETEDLEAHMERAKDDAEWDDYLLRKGWILEKYRK